MYRRVFLARGGQTSFRHAIIFPLFGIFGALAAIIFPSFLLRTASWLPNAEVLRVKVPVYCIPWLSIKVYIVCLYDAPWSENLL